MQHLANQSDQMYSRKWTFDQKWNNVEHALLKQNEQRSDDVHYSKSNLQSKISALIQLENNKVSVINDNIRNLKIQSQNLYKNTEATIQKGKQFENEYENKNMEFALDFLHNSELFAEKIRAYAQNKCNQVERKLAAVDQSIKRKTQDEMKQLRQASINHIKSMITTQTENQKTCLENLNVFVNDSLKNMRQTLKKYQKQCSKSEKKLEDEIEKLDQDIYKCIQKQCKQGEMTYDCLLKLVEDSCSKIQQIRLRG